LPVAIDTLHAQDRKYRDHQHADQSAPGDAVHLRSKKYMAVASGTLAALSGKDAEIYQQDIGPERFELEFTE
jgi:hypothetical protein